MRLARTVAGNSTHAPARPARSRIFANDASSVSTRAFTGKLPLSFSSPLTFTDPPAALLTNSSSFSSSPDQRPFAVKSPGLNWPMRSWLPCTCPAIRFRRFT